MKVLVDSSYLNGHRLVVPVPRAGLTLSTAQQTTILVISFLQILACALTTTFYFHLQA